MANLFENISEKNILKLKKVLKTHSIKYPKGVNVLSNMNQEKYIANIDSGSIQQIYNDYNGNKIIIQELGTDEVFSSLRSISTEEISCIAKEDTQITYFEFDQIMNDEIIRTDFYIIFVKNLLKILSDQLTARNNRIELLTKKTTRDKLLAYFKYQSQINASKRFELTMSFTELASYLSVDRSAMAREIKYLREDGFIETNGKRVRINY